MVYPASKHVRGVFEHLTKVLPASEQTKVQVLILAGEVTSFRNDTDREIVFRQESNFFYLSGCTVPSSYLLITLNPTSNVAGAAAIESDLFIPKAEIADMMWSIPPPSLDEATQTHNVTRVAYTSTFAAAIELAVKNHPGALFHTLPRNSPHFPNITAEYTQLVLSADGAVTDAYLLPSLHQARLIKNADELALIKKANEISSRAHEVVMRVLGKVVKGGIVKGPGAGTDRPLLPGEWLIEKEAEAEAIFVASCRREGAVHQAYLPIVAASTRAATLHYCCNDREFAWGPVGPHDHKNQNDFGHGGDEHIPPQVVLIDAGCEWSCYASDITRTMPVGNGGKFTPEARAIYDLVLDMQKAAFDIIKPGVHWDAVHFVCHQVLVRGFQKLGIFNSPSSPNSGSWNSEEAILSSGVSTAFFPHGLGHSLGMDVHDVPSASKPEANPTIGGITLGHPDFYAYLRLRLPLQEGMVVTVEPGIYFSKHLIAPSLNSKHINRDVLARYESVGGVRIEDVVHITSDGYENFTTVKSETAWVEGVCSGEL